MAEGFPRKFGKYYLLSPLAQGGMGALYLACTGDRGLEKLCVIKTVLPHLADAEYVARFRDEAKVVVKLSHGNLVPVFDAGQVEGEIFLAMDFVEGKDLRAVWNRCAKKAVAFPVDVAVYIVKELCRGLAYAHSFGDLRLVHRDVSPPNVLISFTGEVKLTDFGLASSTLKLEKTAPGVIYGKVSYMSPEQARGEPLDGRTDLYAAGIILWELLTGRQLFPPGREQPQDLLQRAKNPVVEPPSSRAPRVPKLLDEIVLKALAADPQERYQTGEEMRAALAGWLAQEAPATDAARVETFLKGLFAEDLATERREREVLLAKVRERLKTLPPSERLREALAPPDAAPGEAASPKDPIRPLTPRPGVPPVAPHADTEKASPATFKGVAVPVPPPGPGGATIVQGSAGAAAAAVVESVPAHDSAGVIGQIVGGRYHVRSLIGEGGMGRVYEAEHVDIGKRVALKILHPVYSRTPEVVERFRREARAASKIGHPNIVDVTDSGTTADGSVYFVMEMLEGVELAAVIDREGALDVHRALNIGAQICRALAAAHNAGIIHRDLKPENVFLVVREGTTDFVKVLDFGIAKSAELEEQRKERLTHPGMAMGTPEYMAPEQAAGKPADARSDVYAVGAILYEMLTGVPPYEGENFMEILTKKATVDPRPPRELRPEIPEMIERVVMKALARDPAERPPSMEAFEYELTKCLAGRGVAVAKMLGMPIDQGLLVAAPVAAGTGDSARVRLGQLAGEVATLPATATPPAASPTPTMPATAAPASPAPRSAPPASRPPFGTSSPASASAEAATLPPSPDNSLASTDAAWGDPEPGTAIVGRRDGGATRAALAFAFFLVAAGGFAYWYVENTEVDGAVHAATAPAPAVEGRIAEPPAAVEAAERPDRPGRGAREGRDEKTGGRAETGRAEREPPREEPPSRPEPTRVDRSPEKTERSSPKERSTERAERSLAPPKDKYEAKRLLGEAKTAEAQSRWAQARALYERVARGKHHRSSGLLGLANVAWQTKDTDMAIEYARSALKAGAGDEARMLLGHAYYKKGQYDEAIAMYEAILKRSPGNKEAQKALREAEKKRRGG